MTICRFPPALCFTLFLAFSFGFWRDATAADAERDKATAMYDSGKVVDAIPLLEAWLQKHPNDLQIKEHFAWALYIKATTLTDKNERMQLQAQSHSLALALQKAGDKSQILELLLSQPTDGSIVRYSDKAAINSILQEAENAFSNGDFEKAKTGYQKALELDPKNYEASLYYSDVLFRQGQYDAAEKSFGDTIKLNPYRETAYRYLADVLVANGKKERARAQYINAVIAEPYNRLTQMGLQKWLSQQSQEMHFIKLHDRATVGPEKHSLHLDPSLEQDSPDKMAWMAYGLCRMMWQEKEYKKAYPNAGAYRHSLKEEADCLGKMVQVAREMQKVGDKSQPFTDTELNELTQIIDKGFLQPFVLINRADPGIVQDYEAYRAANGSTMRAYLDQYMLPSTSKASSAAPVKPASPRPVEYKVAGVRTLPMTHKIGSWAVFSP